ncbi:hypothetical protein [Fulvivirga sediminis]|nr:hypothetical protein [Fulvivirga sediminis]
MIAEDYSIHDFTDALELREVAKEEGIEDAWILTVPEKDIENS